MTFDDILYGNIAIRSYATFAELKRLGVVPAACKFQIDLVPAHSAIWLYVQEDLQRAIDTPFNDAVLREIDKIAAAIPHDQLAIQFDIASAVFARLDAQQADSATARRSERDAADLLGDRWCGSPTACPAHHRSAVSLLLRRCRAISM